jgi:hypothetical protein
MPVNEFHQHAKAAGPPASSKRVPERAHNSVSHRAQCRRSFLRMHSARQCAAIMLRYCQCGSLVVLHAAGRSLECPTAPCATCIARRGHPTHTCTQSMRAQWRNDTACKDSITAQTASTETSYRHGSRSSNSMQIGSLPPPARQHTLDDIQEPTTVQSMMPKQP